MSGKMNFSLGFKCYESPLFRQGLVQDTTLEEVRGQELHYLLPLKQAQPVVLAKLFHQLEEAKGSLAVSSYGLTSCSLDEVIWLCSCHTKAHAHTTPPPHCITIITTSITLPSPPHHYATIPIAPPSVPHDYITITTNIITVVLCPCVADICGAHRTTED